MRIDRLPKSNLRLYAKPFGGEHSAETLIRAAIDRDMDTVGFVIPSILSQNARKNEQLAQENAFRCEIERLKNAYGNRVEILLGCERDFYAEAPDGSFDYTIGTVHHLCLGGELIAVGGHVSLSEIADRFFEGSVYAVVRCYYETLAELVRKTNCDIVADLDWIRCWNRDVRAFSETDPRYLSHALDALDVLLDRDVLFELNMGKVLLGRERLPFPSPTLLRRIAERRRGVVICSGVSAPERLIQGIAQAAQYARACGMGSLSTLTQNGRRDTFL